MPKLRKLGRLVLAVTCLLLTPIAGFAQSGPLLTAEEVEGLLGVSVVVEARGAGGHSFTSSDPGGGVTIDPMDPAAFAMVPKDPDEAVEGIGDAASFQLRMVNTAVLMVVKGGEGFVLSITYPLGSPAGITDLGETAKELALIAVSKL